MDRSQKESWLYTVTSSLKLTLQYLTKLDEQFEIVKVGQSVAWISLFGSHRQTSPYMETVAKTVTSEANDYAQIFNTISLKHGTNERKTLLPAYSFWFAYIQRQKNSSLTPSFLFPKLKIDCILWKHAFKAKRIAANGSCAALCATGHLSCSFE